MIHEPECSDFWENFCICELVQKAMARERTSWEKRLEDQREKCAVIAELVLTELRDKLADRIREAVLQFEEPKHESSKGGQ